jgi:hypothetical protein
MPHVNRHKLHFGPYRTPRFKYDAKVECEARGEVTIVKSRANAPNVVPSGGCYLKQLCKRSSLNELDIRSSPKMWCQHRVAIAIQGAFALSLRGPLPASPGRSSRRIERRQWHSDCVCRWTAIGAMFSARRESFAPRPECDYGEGTCHKERINY